LSSSSTIREEVIQCLSRNRWFRWVLGPPASWRSSLCHKGSGPGSRRAHGTTNSGRVVLRGGPSVFRRDRLVGAAMNAVTSTSPAEKLLPYQSRRTFAIISHPDAGKTTLTEKLLASSGAIQQAGAVRGRRDQRSTRSDWMEIEQQRGISISSSVMTFEHRGLTFNLLDTAGH